MASMTINTVSTVVARRCGLSSRTSRVAAPFVSKAPVRSTARTSFKTFASTGLFFSTTTGNTEEVADMLSSELPGCADPVDIGDAEVSSLADFDNLVVGAPTWNTGADENRSGTSWDDVLEEIGGLDLSGKKVAVFGCGDSSAYSDYYCDAIEEVYNTFKGAGAEMVGHFPCDTYEFEESKSCVGGPQSSEDAAELLGMAIDVENQSDLTEDRVSAWAGQLKTQMSL